MEKRAVVIVPTYNESENVSRLVPLLQQAFKKVHDSWEMHILVVDDSSPDGTADVVRELMKTQKNLHLLEHGTKSGLGAAYLAGMKHAFHTLKAFAVFEFDADLSHDPEKIPLFLDKIDLGYDMVLGSRYIPGGSIPKNWGMHRKMLSVFGNLFINIMLTNFSIRDWTGGYRAITKPVYEAVSKEMSGTQFTGYTFQVGFLHKAVQKKFKITEVPFHFVDRVLGHSKLGTEFFKNTLVYIVRERIKEVIHMRVFKFGVVGGLGFMINTLGLFLFSRLSVIASFAQFLQSATSLSFINVSGLAAALGAECAIISNFTFNNLWTFRDRILTSPFQIVGKFLQFNLASFGAVLIQFTVVGAGTSVTGQHTISRLFWLVIATGIGMVVNYLIYSKVIWRSKKSRPQ